MSVCVSVCFVSWTCVVAVVWSLVLTYRRSEWLCRRNFALTMTVSSCQFSWCRFPLSHTAVSS